MGGKVSIWKKRKHEMLGVGRRDPRAVLLWLVRSRLQVDYVYGALVNRLGNFVEMWGIRGVLCAVGGGGLVLTFKFVQI